MSDFALAQACDDEPARLAASCARQLTMQSDGHTLGFVYATSPCAHAFGDIVETLKRDTPVQNWVGTIGFGICATATEYFERPALVAMTGRFANDEFQFIPTITSIDDVDAVPPSPDPAFFAGMGVVHGDPRNPQTTEIVEAFAGDRSAYLVGGLTSAETAFPQVAGPRPDGNITDGGISGVLVGGRRQMSIGLTQGCSPIGPAREITKGQGNVIAELDGRSAFEVLSQDAGISEGGNLGQELANVHVAILVSDAKTGDYLVRNLVGIDIEKGLVAIGEDISDAPRVMFVRRGAKHAKQDLERMLDDLEQRGTGAPKAGLYYSCVARGPNLFDDPAHEMRRIRERFGNIPMTGFFGNGEICNNQVYAYTGVLTLFY